MPIPHITGTPTKLICDIPFSDEFPELLVGVPEDSEISYFDATDYLNKSGSPTLSVDSFFFTTSIFQLALVKAYALEAQKVVLCNTLNNHILIDTRLAYLFICYVSPDFIGFVNEAIITLFENGIAYSDQYIATLAAKQLTPEVLTEIANGIRDDGAEPGETGGKKAADSGSDV